MRAAIDLLSDLGHDPGPVVRACGLSLDLFRDPENEAPLDAALQLLCACAKISNLAHFGLMAGARNGLSTLGLVGHLAQTAPNVGVAIADLIGFLNVHDRFARADLTTEGENAILRYIFDRPTSPGADHVYDGVLAALTKMLRSLCGDDWVPTRVTLPRRPPANAAPYFQLFKSEVLFGGDFGRVEFPARWLKRRLPGSNETLRRYLSELVRQVGQASGSEADRVRRIVRVQLVGGTPNADQAAAALGVHPRTLGRRLFAEGLTFRKLVQDLRFEMASDLLTKSNAPMARIAEMLGYSDQAVFSRAFSNRFGHPPSRLRAMKYIHNPI